jgi:nicotinamidase-related amidase
MPRAALIVIDMLGDYFAQIPQLAAHRARLVSSINDLSVSVRRCELPVIWVRQEFKRDLSDAFLDMRRRNIAITVEGTPGAQLLPELECSQADIIIIKKRYSAFFGTNLDEILGRVRPKSLVLAGINTHACIRTAAIDAYQRDYDVVVAADCIASYDDTWHEETLRYLDGKIALVMTNDRIQDLLLGRV